MENPEHVNFEKALHEFEGGSGNQNIIKFNEHPSRYWQTLRKNLFKNSPLRGTTFWCHGEGTGADITHVKQFFE